MEECVSSKSNKHYEPNQRHIIGKEVKDFMILLASKFTKAISRPHLAFPTGDLMEDRKRFCSLYKMPHSQNENLVETL